MEISEALKLFSVEDIGEETDKTLNRKYKQLAKKYHPDSYGGSGQKFKEVSEAYKLLLDLLQRVKLLQAINKIKEEKLIYITFEELLQIYNKTHTSLTKQDLHKNRVLIMFSISTLYKTDIQTFTAVNLWNIDDKYDINIEVKDENILDKSSIDIKIGRENRHVELNYVSTKFIATLEHNIRLSITITKKVK